MKRIAHTLLIIISIFSCIETAEGQGVNKEDLGNLVDALNTRWDEQNPVLYPDGSTIYFTRANDSLNVGGPRDKGDIWYAKLDENGLWGEARNLGRPINNELRNSIIGFSPDGNIMFLNKQMKHPGGLVSSAGIEYSVKKGSTWAEPQSLSVKYFLNRSQNQSGSLSKDGGVMLLSLDSYATRGEEDIYVSFYQNGVWTQPQNLGSTINTDAQEMTPFISPDHQMLYFSSNGHGGAGGRDLFMAARQDDGWRNWSDPKPVPGAVNSIGVELGYHIDYINEIAYFSSTQNSDGYGDIQATPVAGPELEEIEEEQFEELIITEEVPVLVEAPQEQVFRGLVIDAKDERPIAAAVYLKTEQGMDENMGTDGTIGTFEIQLPKDISVLLVSIKAPGYMGIEERVALAGEGMTEQIFKLDPLEVGTTIQLNKVYFERGQAILIDSSYSELDRLSDMLVENPNVQIELAGHTDNQGNAKLNLQLSRDRVEVVKEYLVARGIDTKRIKGKGYGGTRPVASNASETTRKLNRRVEFKVLKK